MSPDARAICTALLYVHGWPAAGIPASIGDIQALLPKEPGIRGMVPVGWVTQMLDELFSVAAQVTPQPVPVADKIMSIRAQLEQFREDS